ncbi:MAG: ABC transporter ATP-binding protein [Sarcina sp.]
MNAVEIKNLNKKLGEFTLNIERLEIPQGYITGFIGKNGSGKTTTIKLIMDMLFPDSGEIKIFNKSLKENEIEVKSQIAYVGIDSGYPQKLPLKKIKTMIARFYPSWDEKLYAKYISKFELNEKILYKDLSSGKKKQFELCMALSHRPKLLIMDEPTVNLDPVIRNEFIDMLSEHLESDEMSVFYSSHITSDLEKSADYIYFIDKGRILLSGEKDLLLEQHRIVKGPNSLINEATKKNLIGLKNGQFGFDALTNNYKEVFEAFGDEAVYERVCLEDLMIYYLKNS